ESPTVLGWGGSRLVENTLYSNTTIPSIVFPFENASDQEVLARRIVEMGLNAIRISLAPYCTDPNGFMSPYNSTRLDRAIRIGDTHWIAVQNLCSFGCNLCPSGNGDCPAAVNGYPRVTDPLGRVFISLHTYMPYDVYYNSWNNTAAEDLARNYYDTMTNGTSLTGF